MLVQSGDVTSWKVGIYGKSFSAGQRNWVCVHPCVRVLCVEGEGQLITSFTRNTAWVAERNHQNYPRAVLACSQGDGATNSPASSHAVSLCFHPSQWTVSRLDLTLLQKSL